MLRALFVYCAPMTVWLLWVSLRSTISTVSTPQFLQIAGRSLLRMPHRFKFHLHRSVRLSNHFPMVQRLVQTVFGHNILKICNLVRPTTINSTAVGS